MGTKKEIPHGSVVSLRVEILDRLREASRSKIVEVREIVSLLGVLLGHVQVAHHVVVLPVGYGVPVVHHSVCTPCGILASTFTSGCGFHSSPPLALAIATYEGRSEENNGPIQS